MSIASRVNFDNEESIGGSADDNQIQEAAYCSVCHGDLPLGHVSLCPICSEAGEPCAEEEFGNDDQPGSRINAVRPPVLQNVASPTRGHRGESIITVKPPSKLIQDKILAAFALNERIDLVLSPERPGSNVRVLVDVRTPNGETGYSLNDSRSRAQQINPSRSVQVASNARGRRAVNNDEDVQIAVNDDEDVQIAVNDHENVQIAVNNDEDVQIAVNDDEDVQIVAVRALTDQIQDRYRQAEESGNMIILTASQDDDDSDTNNQAASIERVLWSDDGSDCLGSSIRKRPAQSSVSQGRGSVRNPYSRRARRS